MEPSFLPLTLFFNPFLTIHLSVLIHVKIRLIVSLCVRFQRRAVICLLSLQHTGQVSKHVVVCD